MPQEAITGAHTLCVAEIRDIDSKLGSSLAYATASTSTGVFTEGIYALWSDQACHIAIGPTPTAATGVSYLLRQNVTEAFLIRKNSKIGVQLDSSAGTLFWMPIG